MVPFCMRILHAELPMYRGSLHLALNRLCLLQSTTQQVLELVQAGRVPLSEEVLDAKQIEGFSANHIQVVVSGCCSKSVTFPV